MRTERAHGSRAGKAALLTAVAIAMSGCGLKPLVEPRPAASSLPAECEGDASYCEVLTSYRGVNVYRNHSAPGSCKSERCGDPRNRYGWRWQCVELFNRFFAHQFGIGPIAADAKDLFAIVAAVPGLEARPNGGARPPAPGDALVFGGTPTGHVAIITDITTTQVHVVEQNAPGDGENAYAYDPLTRKVAAPPPAVTLGWIHSSGG